MIQLRVPGSVANLGPGFDLLAMAVDLWLEVEAQPADQPEWTFEGEGADVLRGSPNPFSRLPFRGRVRSGIPLGVGLGSSAAARLAALALANPEHPDLLGAAAAGEGHPDNAAAAHGGGMVLVIGREVHALPSPDLDVALLVARRPFPTEEARKVVPRELSREDAVFNAGRIGLFVHALHTRRWELLGPAMEDRIHQPHRFRLFPWVPGVMRAAQDAGAHGSALAGAGPSVFALCDPGRGGEVASAMAAAAPEHGLPLVTRVAPAGMRWVR